mmetsp:Transcript_29114/g.41645  ORF Transcript_29114/g.41645 Transcript_29114/m.41645 type:complete len:182 (+) Transcript_29114:8-553(+)
MTMKNLLLAIAITILYTALPTAQGFGLGGGNKTRRGAAAQPSSPLLEDALKSYPFVNDDKTKLSTNFNELARLYGDEEALQMAKIMPRVLRFDSNNFEPCLESWTEQFGLEKAQAMVKRNPGLLGVKPSQTEDADSSMYGSYLVAVLRPSPLSLAVWGVLLIALAGNKDFWVEGGFYNGGQ